MNPQCKKMLVLVLPICGILAAGCVTQSKYDEMETSAIRLKTMLDKAEKLSAERKQKLDALEADIAKMKAALKKSGVRLKTVKTSMGKKLSRALARIKAEMRRQKALNDKLRRSFNKMISAGKLKLVNRNGRLVIQMRSKVLFASGKAKLTKGGRKAVRRLGRVLRYIRRHFLVAGHTDSIPTRGVGFKDNWVLSATRAIVVVRLLRKSGVPGRRLSAAGYGQYDPVRSNGSRAGRVQNRRIEITLFPSVSLKRLR
jgi:chemotaxis protein MotB